MLYGKSLHIAARGIGETEIEQLDNIETEEEKCPKQLKERIKRSRVSQGITTAGFHQLR